jgi:hypothetical protein
MDQRFPCGKPSSASVRLRAIWLHPESVRLRRDAGSGNAAGGQLDEEQRRRSPLLVQTSTVKKSAAAVGSQCRVRNSSTWSYEFAARRRFYGVALPNTRDCAAGQFVAEIGGSAADSKVSPIPVLHGHTDNQGFQFLPCCRPTPPAVSAAVVFVPMSFRCHGVRR